MQSELNILRHMVANRTSIEQSANTVAIGSFACNVEDYDVSNDVEDVFGKNTGFATPVVCEAFEDFPQELLLSQAFDLRDIATNAITAFADNVHKGLVILVIDISLDGDANNWDLEAIAGLGYITSQTIEHRINGVGVKLTFCANDLKWKSTTGGDEFEFDRVTGLPILDAD